MTTEAAPVVRRGLVSRVHPLVTAALGAACIAFSAPFVAFSGTDAATVTVFRCVLALPVLAALMTAERQRRPVPRRDRWVAVAAGVLLGLDLLLWSAAIGEVGVGISTVIVNMQVVLVPLLAFVVDRERPTRRFLLAVGPMLCGVAVAGGVGQAVAGSDPLLGTAHAALAALAYAGYLFILRRRSGGDRLVQPVFDATIGAAVAAAVIGVLWHGIDLTPGWAAFGWLAALALVGQVSGWLLLASSLPRLTSRAGSAILLLPPVAVVLLAYLLLGQQPTLLQLGGCVLVVLAVGVALSSAS